MVAIATMRYFSGVERIPEHIPVFIFVRCRVDSLMFPRSSRYSRERNFAESLVLSPLTCDQALFSFRSVKHSGGTGETKNRA